MTKPLTNNDINVKVGGVNRGQLHVFMAGHRHTYRHTIRVLWPQRITGTQSIPSCDLNVGKMTNNQLFKYF